MKLLSFTRLGKTGFGAVVKDGIVDLTGKLDPEINSIKELISLNMENEAEEYIAGKTKDLSFSDFTFLPVIPNPEKIMCIGLNYLEHKKETGRPDVDNPTIFTGLDFFDRKFTLSYTPGPQLFYVGTYSRGGLNLFYNRQYTNEYNGFANNYIAGDVAGFAHADGYEGQTYTGTNRYTKVGNISYQGGGYEHVGATYIGQIAYLIGMRLRTGFTHESK